MNENFLRFKKRQNGILLLSAILIGMCVGLAIGGAFLILAKLDILGIAPIYSIPVGGGAFAVTAVIAYLISRKSDVILARELDERFKLKEKVQTMMAYSNQSGEMLTLQREDTDRTLAEIKISELKMKKPWIYVTALCLSVAILVGGVLVPNIWQLNQNPPFSLSAYQIEGLNELIKYVELSPMEEEYRLPMAEELRSLLDDLRLVDNENDMRAELAETMAIISNITYESSNAAEILDLLWETEDRYFKYMAKWLDTSSWSSPDEGDYAERLVEYLLIVLGEDADTDNKENGEAETPTEDELKSRIVWALDSISRKGRNLISNAQMYSDDNIYKAIYALVFADGESGQPGLESIFLKVESLDYEQLRGEVTNTFYGIYSQMYEAISIPKINTNVGEYVMTRLSNLFAVPAPEFERPGFVKRGESVEGNQGSAEDDNKENGNTDGGVGEGATYGSDDYVLDPLTGKYDKYGDLIEKYYGIMNEKLDNGSYTEEQKEIIKKYFDLLYSGLEDK